ncbi:hypothetical protein CR513_35582, partial [Mucuna pruriens]
MMKKASGTDVEVYVDDMVVKSTMADKHCSALERSVREVQQLVGRITALSRFISRSTKTAIPIFDTLKKGGNFAWTLESEEAFLRLKALLVAPPCSNGPREGREAISNLFHEQGPLSSDGPPNPTSAAKARPGWEDGGLERLTVRL